MRTEHRIIWTDSQARAILNTRIGASPGEAIDPSQPALWQARRPFLHQPAPDVDEIIFDAETATATFPTERGKRVDLRCPFGVPGDLLWGAECWAVDEKYDSRPPSELGHTPIRFRTTPDGCFRPWLDNVNDYRWSGRLPLLNFGSWRSSVQLPRDFARIWHEFVEVRAERLSVADGVVGDEDKVATAEGVISQDDGQCLSRSVARVHLVAAWESVYGSGSWASNPWTWVLGLRRVDHA